MRSFVVACLAVAIFGAGFGAAWSWRGDRCEAKTQTVVATNAKAREDSTNEARAVEGKQEATTRSEDDVYQKNLARLEARRKPARRPGTLLGLRQSGVASASGVPALAQGAAVADAAAADAVPDRGCDQLEKDSERTTLSCHHLQRWLLREGLADPVQAEAAHDD